MHRDPRIGRMVADRYRLERVIGRGGMGIVYGATHTWTERPVAVKVLLPDAAMDTELLNRFFQEAKAAGTLRHPNVVDVLDMGEDDDGSAFLVLELLVGEPLEDRLKREGRLEPGEGLRVLLPVMDALEAAHQRGIIHRDLKPENVFLAQSHQGVVVPKLLDFGIAKLTEGATVKTATGSMLGTPGYMSPEQIQSLQHLTPGSDVWGMGMLLSRTLTGQLPVNLNMNPAALLMAIVMDDRPPIATLWPDGPPHVARAIDGCLRRSLDERYGSMHALIDALLQAAEADGIELTDPRHSIPSGVY